MNVLNQERKIVMTEKELDDFSDKMLQQTIDGINEVTYRERARNLSEFSTAELVTELIKNRPIDEVKAELDKTGIVNILSDKTIRK